MTDLPMTIEQKKTLAELRAIRERIGRTWLDAENLADRCRKNGDMPPGLFTLRRLLNNARDAAEHALTLQSE